MVAMQMTGSSGILSVPSEHIAGLVVLVTVLPAVWVALWGLRSVSRKLSWAEHLVQRFDCLSFTAKAVLFASLIGASVHAAIVPAHWASERVTAILFVLDAVAFVLVFVLTFGGGRHWRAVSAALLFGTAGAYVLYVLRGWETMDLVGLLTTTIELAAALVVLSPAISSAGSPSREGWLAFGAIPVAMVTLLGTGAIASVSGTSAAASSPTTLGAKPSMPSMSSKGASGALALATMSAAGPIAWPDDMGTMAAGMKMATPNCTAQPTAAQQTAAIALVDQTVSAAAPYKSLAAAKAAGYVPLTPTGQKIVHYINPSLYREGNLVDPKAIPVLVFVNTSHGAVLSAAMYLMPRSSGDAKPPQPGGCLTQWHVHTDLCFSAGKVAGNDNGGSCPAGSVNVGSEPMMHVWLTPVPGGPLAPDPPARSEVLAAMQMPLLSPPNGTA
jgi:hypothetical protein